MKKPFFAALLLMFSSASFADHHSASASEAEVMEALFAYMDARNTRDFEKVVEMSSKAGTLDTNSDPVSCVS